MNVKDISFIIISPEGNSGALQNSFNSLKFLNTEVIAIVGESVKENNLQVCQKLLPTFVGKNTITSLLDEGVKQSKKSWLFFCFAGVWLNDRTIGRYLTFVEGVKDIVFTVVDRKCWFYEGSLNGLLFSRKAFEDIGCFGNDATSLIEAKLAWADKAIAKNYQIKGIVGIKFI